MAAAAAKVAISNKQKNQAKGASIHPSPTRSGDASLESDNEREFRLKYEFFPYDEVRYGGFFQYQQVVQKFYNRQSIQIGVAVLIALNFLTNMINAQLYPPEAQKLYKAYAKDYPLYDIYNPDIADDGTTAPRKEDVEYGDSEAYQQIFDILGIIYNLSFLIELLVNMYAHWCYFFWRDPWNQFDFVVVVIGMLTDPIISGIDLGPARLLRNMRAFRVFRLFKRVKSLNKIIVSLGKALTGMFNAFLIMFLVMCIYALLAVEFWGGIGRAGYMDFVVATEDSKLYSQVDDGDIDPGAWNYKLVPYLTSRGGEYGNEYFGNFFRALYTLFQVLTGESWSEAIARPLIEQNDASAVGTGIFFVSFIIVNQIVLQNVVVAVLLEKMVDDEPPLSEEEVSGNFPSPDEAIAPPPGPEGEVMLGLPEAGREATPNASSSESSTTGVAKELQDLRQKLDELTKKVESLPQALEALLKPGSVIELARKEVAESESGV